MATFMLPKNATASGLSNIFPTHDGKRFVTLPHRVLSVDRDQLRAEVEARWRASVKERTPARDGLDRLGRFNEGPEAETFNDARPRPPFHKMRPASKIGILALSVGLYIGPSPSRSGALPFAMAMDHAETTLDPG
jgi:hypothetical protein